MEAGNISSVLLLHNAFIVTMDSESRVFRNGALVIAGDRIEAVGRSLDILRDFSHRADEIIDLAGRFLLPGFINTHVHTSQQLARGIADDVDLMTWLHERIWPYESNMTEEDSYISTLLCGIELIRTGVTCFAEAGGQHVSGMARAVKLLGLRACLTQSTMDSGQGLPANWSALSTDDCIQVKHKILNSCNAFTWADLWWGDPGARALIGPTGRTVLCCRKRLNGRIKVWFGLRQIMNATDRLLTETKKVAQELKTGIHMHVAEIPYENELVMDTRQVDHGTVSYLETIGLLGSNLLAAHSVWVDEDEIGLLAKADVKVSHCPAAAMRMLGFCPIKEMLDLGVCVSLGTDGAPSNNRMSIGWLKLLAITITFFKIFNGLFRGNCRSPTVLLYGYKCPDALSHELVSRSIILSSTCSCFGRQSYIDEMYLASLINKGREAYIKGTTNPTALPAEVVLKMATINGAKSVLLDNEIGSIEIGKKADMVIINPFSWSMLPLHDSISNLVYCMRTENIESVMCNGQWILKDKKITNLDEEEVFSLAMKASSDILKRAGISLPDRFNCL
ncbi:uncharacterized protein LOC110103880 isoform X1 [Dendrobium catenatum]|uniref:uncharacterized protein LOC110103880 isoform X1 n=1 Tax=Dendrobium catenatum TaxID=906689 RepID=UPI0010A0A17C|nr:uncharacterized protein LOC110103880 isoform X1 [Dendrobium catenatum]